MEYLHPRTQKIDSDEANSRLERGVKEGDTVSPKLSTRVLDHKFRKLNQSSKRGRTINDSKLII
jgi:hypothetical protein